MNAVDWVLNHQMEIVTTVTSIITAASVVAKLTPTPKDDAFLAKVMNVVHFIALNTKRDK